MLFKSVAEFKAEGLPWVWPNFTPEELACKCDGRYCQGEYWHDQEFMTALQTMRIEIGKPFRINSGHRCVGHNAAVGGSMLSQHKKIAVDISLEGHDRHELYASAVKWGFTGIGRYRTFIHLDRRDGHARWFGAGARELW